VARESKKMQGAGFCGRLPLTREIASLRLAMTAEGEAAGLGWGF